MICTAWSLALAVQYAAFSAIDRLIMGFHFERKGGLAMVAIT
jgi:hypothetical protein